MTKTLLAEIDTLNIEEEINRYRNKESARGFIDKTPQTGYCSVTSGDCTRVSDFDPPLTSNR